MARRETPIVITSADEMPTWEQLPQVVRDIFQRGFERKLQRLRAEGVQVWIPVGEGLGGAMTGPVLPHPERPAPQPERLPSGAIRWTTILTPRQGQAWTRLLLHRPARPLPTR